MRSDTARFGDRKGSGAARAAVDPQEKPLLNAQ